MHLTYFAQHAKTFSRLGGAIQEQAEYFFRGGRDSDQLNANALAHIQSWLEEVVEDAEPDSALEEDCREMIQEIAEYLGD